MSSIGEWQTTAACIERLSEMIELNHSWQNEIHATQPRPTSLNQNICSLNEIITPETMREEIREFYNEILNN